MSLNELSLIVLEYDVCAGLHANKETMETDLQIVGTAHSDNVLGRVYTCVICLDVFSGGRCVSTCCKQPVCNSCMIKHFCTDALYLKCYSCSHDGLVIHILAGDSKVVEFCDLVDETDDDAAVIDLTAE